MPWSLSHPISGSFSCDEIIRTPSTCPAPTYEATFSRSAAVPATRSSSVMPRWATASAAPRSRIEKFGSVKSSRCGSVSRKAIELLRPVTRLRAWWFVR